MLSARSPVTSLAVETTISAAAELARPASSSTSKQPTTVLARLSRFFSASCDDSVIAGNAAAPESAATAALAAVSTASTADLDRCSSNGTVSAWIQSCNEFGVKILTAMSECDEDCTCDHPNSSPASSYASSPSSTTSSRTSDSDIASRASYTSTPLSTRSTRSSRSTRSRRSQALDDCSDSSESKTSFWGEVYSELTSPGYFTCGADCPCNSEPSSPASSRSSTISSAASSRIFDSASATDSPASDSDSLTSYETTPTSTRSTRSNRSSQSQRQSAAKLVAYGSPYAEHFDLRTIAEEKDHERRCRERKSRKPRGDDNFGQELYPRMPVSEMYSLKFELRRQQLQPYVDEFEKRKGRRMRVSEANELKYKLLTPDVAKQPKQLSKRIAQIRDAYARENQLHEQIGGRRLRASEVPAFYCPQPLPEHAHYGMLAVEVDYKF
ncbi:hypothetical protein NBRC10512_003019 [Rhodotorula toruloides]|uniref:RHTO0S14e03466g1_1 n=2 Tax=Rhodotorula toruloides TaxID=5286 RepID=A0A061BBU7_RHOTO|nr:uncharacterized protein RHTO_05038 [Rhodotorula toruloides NP11]EMS24858.1 hypothetical protein RHTO_05038 [Rhodotorula toruloides NP11]KAJ8297304.1 hypothetical protein OF846_000526 [Rhodotorula toruloides]CDR47417.1 RHTO0S14e03466g1_1 [Rhodotorula toruloides]